MKENASQKEIANEIKTLCKLLTNDNLVELMTELCHKLKAELELTENS